MPQQQKPPVQLDEPDDPLGLLQQSRQDDPLGLLGSDSASGATKPVKPAPAATPAPRRGIRGAIGELLTNQTGESPQFAQTYAARPDRKEPPRSSQGGGRGGGGVVPQIAATGGRGGAPARAVPAPPAPAEKQGDVKFTDERALGEVRGQARRIATNPMATKPDGTPYSEEERRLAQFVDRNLGARQEREDFRGGFGRRALDAFTVGRVNAPAVLETGEARAAGDLVTEEDLKALGLTTRAGKTLRTEPTLGESIREDMAPTLVGQLPLYAVGGAAGRVATAGIAGGLEAAAGTGRLAQASRGIGGALRKAATGFESYEAVGPNIPVTRALASARIGEEVATLRANLPNILKRGATEGQIVGAVLQYQQSRQNGATVEQALEDIAAGLPLDTAMGVAGEVGLSALGRALGAGIDPIARPAGQAYRGAREALGQAFGTNPPKGVEGGVELGPTAPIRGVGGEAELGQALPPIEPKRAELGQAFDALLEGRRGERGRDLTDVFAQPHPDETPAGPEFWENLPADEPRMSPEDQARMESLERIANGVNVQRSLREEAHSQIEELRAKYTQPPGEPLDNRLPDSPVDRPLGPLQSAEPRSDRLRSAREIAMGEERPQLQPHEEANAFVQMQRMEAEQRAMAEAQANDPDLRLELAAQARPGEKQGPLTLAQTIARAGREADAGEPLAVEYRDAINQYVDAAAAARDTEEPSTKQRVALARARSALDAARKKYGAQLGASAVLGLAANSEDLSDEEKELVGLGGLAILSTDVTRLPDAHPVMQRVPFYSRLKSTITALPKAWNDARPAADWIGKLKGTNTFSKKELELLMPELNAAVRDKRKLTRAEVQEIADRVVPQIKRITLAHRGATQPLEAGANRHGIVDIDELGPTIHADDLQAQVEVRNERIREIENEISRAQEQAEEEMNEAEREMDRTHRKIRDRLEEAGLDRAAADAAIEHIDERVEAEHVPRGTLAGAMSEIRDELYGAGVDVDARSALEEGGYTWELEDEKGPELVQKVQVTWKGDPQAHPDTGVANGPPSVGTFGISSDYSGRIRQDDGTIVDTWRTGRTSDPGRRPIGDHVARAREMYGDQALIEVVDNQAEIDAFEPNPDNQATVVRNSQGKEISRDVDEDTALQEAADSAGPRTNTEELIGDIESLLEEYANDRANYQAKESEHYFSTEGDAFREQNTEKDQLKSEASTIEEWINEGGGSEIMGGEPTPPEVVATADEDTPIIPEPSGSPEYASYQRIGGGTEYAELLNVIENQPQGQDYEAGHYSDWKNVASHIRRETHDIRDVPGLSGKDVQFVEGEDEYTRTQKSHIIENRNKRDRILGEMTEVAHGYEALPEADREGDRAHELARTYRQLNQQVIDVSNRIEEIIGTIAPAGSPRRRVAVMIESQSDWSQGASRYGIRRERTPEEQMAIDGLDERLNTIAQELAGLSRAQRDHAWGSEKYKEIGAQTQALEKIRRDLAAERANLRENPSAVPQSPLVDSQAVTQLNAARFLLDSAERGFEDIAWSDAANRVKNASLPMQAALLQYDELTRAAMKRLLQGLGFQDVKPEKLYIKGEGHWNIRLTPEMRRAIVRAGLPILSVMALANEAEAQDGKGTPKQGSMYATAVGGVAAGAALMYLAKNRKVRRLIKEHRALERALNMDELSGLANKRAFTLARPNVDNDPNFHWVVMDGDRFKAINDTHGHSEGDKAIRHFGQTVMDVADEMKIPLRGFRFGGDEIAFAAPAGAAPEFMKLVEERSPYTKGETTTKLTGGMGKTFDEADANLNARKEANRRADPSLRRKGDTGGVTLYANPIPQALRELARYPSAAAMAAVGAGMTDSEDEDIAKTGKAMIALGALSAVGSKRMAAGRDMLGRVLLDQLTKSGAGTGLARAFNPEALLSDDVKKAISTYEAGRSKASARGAEMAREAQALGPVGDRAVSDVLENEGWEDTTQMSPQDMTATLTFASKLAQEYDDISAGLVASGARDPLELLDTYAGPRRYAYYEGHEAQTDEGPFTRGQQPRISQKKRRTLDEPIRAAEAQLAEAQASGDPQAISDAQDAIDAAKVEQLSRREELGEIRESSYRAAQGVTQGHADIAAAELFSELRNAPGAVHPEWLQASDELDAARQMRAQATTPADRQAAQQLIDEATVKLHDRTRAAEKKGGSYVALPNTRTMGRLRGAVVQRDVANSLVGFNQKNLYLNMLRAWKEVKTVFNPGTHAANVLSNIAFSHMEGLPIWEQPLWLKRARADLKAYGPAARALAESGVLNQNSVFAEGEGVGARELNTQEGLEQMLATTRPRTAEVLRETGITEVGARSRRNRSTAKGAAAGAALLGARAYSEENPEDALGGAAVGALAGAGLARGRKRLRQLYSNEDNIFRAAIWLRKVKDGMTPDQATAYTREALGNFRTRSPAIQVLKSSVAPFILYPSKALPRFASQVVDHPWRYAALIAAWGGLNEYAQSQVGAIDEDDKKPSDRRKTGYALPGFTQLPFANKQGDKAGVDVARWTPLSAATTAAPPGSVPASFDESLPDIFRISGPVTDLATRFGSNVDPFTRKAAYGRDYPLKENLGNLANDLAGVALPPAADFHAERIREDVRNRDFDKLGNDVLGPTGLRPRFTRPGAQLRESSFQLENSLREFKQDLRRQLINNKNPGRVQVLIDRHQRFIKQAFDNFRERTGQQPPAHLVELATSPDQ